MQNAINKPVLVLDYCLSPVSIRSARRALTLIVKGRAAVVEEHENHEVCRGFKLPSVIRLKEYRYIPARVQILSRRNILLRDSNICQYCGKHFTAAELTLDHIIPKSRGGKEIWSNLVCACSRCNRYKADRTPEEAGMVLLHKPRPASIHTSRFVLKSMGEDDPLWRPYLYFDSTGDKRYQHVES